MTAPRHALEAERQIVDFNVFEQDDGSWLAVHKHDPRLRLAHADWRDLFWLCVGAQISATLREAAEELANRMASPERVWRHKGPGSGINI